MRQLSNDLNITNRVLKETTRYKCIETHKSNFRSVSTKYMGLYTDILMRVNKV